MKWQIQTIKIMTHTRVLYWTKAVGEKRIKHDYVFTGVELKTRKDAADYLDFGKPGNFLIAEAQGLSKYGILQDWKVTKSQVISDEYLDSLDEIRRAEDGLEALRQQARDSRKETRKLIKRTEELNALNRKELERIGWGSLTEEEFEWFYKTGNKTCYFIPSASQIKSDYALAQTKLYQAPDAFAGFEELRHTNGWLDPYGKYFPVDGFAEHNNWASNYLFRQNSEFSDADRGYAYEKLQDLGWLRVMDWGGSTKIQFGYSKTPTHDQKETLQLFCALHKIEYTLD
jgi:hypothetical protein